MINEKLVAQEIQGLADEIASIRTPEGQRDIDYDVAIFAAAIIIAQDRLADPARPQPPQRAPGGPVSPGDPENAPQVPPDMVCP